MEVFKADSRTSSDVVMADGGYNTFLLPVVELGLVWRFRLRSKKLKTRR